MTPPAWLRAQAPMLASNTETGFPTTWPKTPRWPWVNPLVIQPGYVNPAARQHDLSDSAFFGVTDDWAIQDMHDGQPGGIIPPQVGVALMGVSDARGVDYYAQLSNVIPDRAGRTLTYWAAAEAALHPGMRPMVEWDAPSIQTTIRRGTVLSDPYVAELRARGVIGPGVPASPPAWTLQGYLYYQGLARQTNAGPRPGGGGVVRAFG